MNILLDPSSLLQLMDKRKELLESLLYLELDFSNLAKFAANYSWTVSQIQLINSILENHRPIDGEPK